MDWWLTPATFSGKSPLIDRKHLSRICLGGSYATRLLWSENGHTFVHWRGTRSLPLPSIWQTLPSNGCFSIWRVRPRLDFPEITSFLHPSYPVSFSHQSLTALFLKRISSISTCTQIPVLGSACREYALRQLVLFNWVSLDFNNLHKRS